MRKPIYTKIWLLTLLSFLPWYNSDTNAQTQLCQADFSWNVGIFGPTIFFTDLSTGNPDLWNWDFGDGTSSHMQNTHHVYNFAGTYVVCLTITSFTSTGSICTDQFCDTVIASGCIDSSLITGGPCPLAFDPVCGCNGVSYDNSCEAQQIYGVSLWRQGNCCDASFTWQHCIDCPLVFFNNNSTGPYNHVQWDFGDGSTSIENNPTHQYNTTGTYLACLSVYNPTNGCYDTFCDSVLATGCIDSSLITGGPCPLFYDPVCGCNGNSYDNSCFAKEAGVAFWYPGACGSDTCEADFGYSYGIIPPTIFFFDQSTGNPSQWYWDFGDGNTSTLQNPWHDYYLAGAYEVCLNIVSVTSSGFFCTDTYCDTVFAPGCIDSSVIDPTFPCPAIYNPVCGCDSVTYSSACVAYKYHGVTLYTQGPCPGDTYCQSQGLNSSVGWIEQVGPVVSGNNGGYAYFNKCNFTLNAGTTISIPLKGAVNNPPPGARAKWRVWIDYNHDKDFDDIGELAWQGTGGLTKTAVVSIPPGVCTGCTRLRFQLSNQFQSECGTYSFGETEDYDVTILGALCPIGNKVAENPLFESTETLSLNVYPNPAQQSATIEIISQSALASTNISIYDITGKMIFIKELNQSDFLYQFEFPVSELTNGIYQVTVETPAQNISKKLIVVH